MTTVSMVRLGSATPMGQQAYESELLAALRRQSADRWTITDLAVLPMRAVDGVGRRLPLRVMWSAPYSVAIATGLLAYGRADLIHRLDLRCPPSGRLEVVTIHDLPPLRFDDEGSLPRWAARSARAAAAVICPSQFAAEEVRDLLGVAETHVVPCGVDSSRAAATAFSQAELAELGLRGPVVVHAAGATSRKNLPLLAAAWAEVAGGYPDASLALCGPRHWRRDELFADLPSAVYLGFRPAAFVARLMKAAAAVVIPSTYEGFGLPALEAMAAGATVVAVACGALPEVCGDAALLVAPDADEFAAAIGDALAGGEAVERLRAAGRERAALFSWERAARETAAIYERVLS